MAQAALKYARYLRGDNPVGDPTPGRLKAHIFEEATDVSIVADALGIEGGADEIRIEKLKRMHNRLINAGKIA